MTTNHEIPLHSHQLDNVTEHDDPSGWSVRTYTYEGQDWTDIYERPSHKGWMSPLVVDSYDSHLPDDLIKTILERLSKQETRGDHYEE